MKTKITLLLFAGIFALLFTGTTSSASTAQSQSSNPEGWELLGRRVINWGVDHDEIAAAAQGTFTAIKLKLQGGPVNMLRCVIHFGDGSQQEVELRSVIPAGGESRVIDLAGNTRIITRVSLWYDTKNRARSKASIAVWGRH